MKLNIKVISNGSTKAPMPCPWIMDVPPDAPRK